MDTYENRRVVGNITLSLDGRVNGEGGDYDMSWIVPHATTDIARDHMIRVTGPGTTALLGRKNYEGFSQYWPAVADDETADPRDRAFSSWLNGAEKVVFSTTLTDAPWPAEGGSSRVSTDPVDEVRRLRGQDGGGARLFDDKLPASDWTLADLTATDSGATCLLYDRKR